MDNVISEPIATSIFRHIRPGFERIPSYDRPRHAHLAPYATVLLDGAFEQASFGGRMRVEPGDVLIQPVLDRHDSRCRSKRGLHLLRLPWIAEAGVGGVYRISGIDLIIKEAMRDPIAASALLQESIRGVECEPAVLGDWPDFLAAHLREAGVAGALAHWAAEHNLARETVSRGFTRVFGVCPRQFLLELKARDAWLQIVTRRDDLAVVAHDLGYADQPHMTRAVRAFTGATPGTWRRHFVARETHA